MTPAGVVLLVVIATGCVVSCAGDGSDVPPRDPLLAEAPDWVVFDCTHYWDGRPGARLCGVGSVAGTRNLSLARTAAVGRARNDIALRLRPMVESMLRDYSHSEDAPSAAGATSAAGASSAPGEGGAGSDARGREKLSAKQITNIAAQITQFTTMSGTTLRDTWVAPDGTLYTVVDLDVAHFEDAVDQMSSLTDAIRAGVKARAGAAFRSATETPL